MAATIETNNWLKFLREEYLDSFIKNGGGAVKFTIPLEESLREQLEHGISEQSNQLGYIVTRISSARTRVNMMNQVFFGIAEQIPWQELTRRVLNNFAREKYGLPPVASSGPIATHIADATGLTFMDVRREADIWISQNVTRFMNASLDFRLAMTHLCSAEMYGGRDGEIRKEMLANWLTGRNTAISAVRPYQIYNKITRTNARHLLESLLRWIKYAGYSGLVVIMDASRLTIDKNPHDSDLFYTKAVMLDAYEMLRQFIDRMDRMESFLLVVDPALQFTDQEGGSRGLGSYQALNHRVFDEVQDKNLVNPMGAMVRLSP